jgi:hypothetical protein
MSNNNWLSSSVKALLIALSASLATACFIPLLGNQSPGGQRYVGILYETWFNHLMDDGRHAVPTYPDAPASSWRRFWANPAPGKYLSDDPAVADLHMAQLAEAGVDFLVVDYSNGNVLDFQLNNPIHSLIAVVKRRLDDGKATPRITFLINGREADISKLYREIYQPNGMDGRLFFQLEGKPLLLPTEACDFPVTKNFTLRPTWGLLKPADDRWSFMELYPQRIAYRNGKAEEMAVSAAQQITYMSEKSSARSRSWSHRSGRNDGGFGENFLQQWKLAKMVRPSFVLIKSWNEWIAYGPQYTDEYDAEFSNDLEPMQGGHGDKFLRLMRNQIALYKEDVSISAQLRTHFGLKIGYQMNPSVQIGLAFGPDRKSQPLERFPIN